MSLIQKDNPPALSALTISRDEAIDQFLSMAGWGGAVRRKLAGDASFRRYERVEMAGKKAVLMDAPPEKEDVRPYLKVAKYLSGCGYSAPVILAADETNGLLLLEDLGDSLFSAMIREGASEETLYRAAVEVLIEWHMAPAGIRLAPYDDALLLQEVSLFADWYMPLVAGKDKAGALRAEYMALWQKLLGATKLETRHFIHRDYHADNLLWLPDRGGAKRVGLLDFQDAVLGDAAYDLVSLLEDARRDVNPVIAEKMLQHYIGETGSDPDEYRKSYALLGAQRNTKIVGIFARLAVRDGKKHYLKLLPRVWGHLQRNVKHPDLVSLAEWLDTHIKPEWRGEISV